jgi:hypothetical protein
LVLVKTLLRGDDGWTNNHPTSRRIKMDEKEIRAAALQAAVAYISVPGISAAGFKMAEEKKTETFIDPIGVMNLADIFSDFIRSGTVPKH